MKKKTIIGALIALLIIAGLIAACIWVGLKMRDATTGITVPPGNSTNPTSPTSPPENSTALNKSLPLGNPTNAVPNVSNAGNYLMTGDFFSMSFNRDKGIPNWVSWALTGNDFGDIDRQNNFRPDPRLPADWKKVTPTDYVKSGYDRGHFCPSADRSNSVESNSATFLMTNMAPQTHELNAGPWEKLETYSRSMARRKNTLFIIAGNYGEQGKIKNKISIPTNFWKIIVVVPDGTQINKDSRVIAVDMPNIKGISDKNWRDYITSIQQIEQKTGYKFLSNLSPDLQNSLKSKIDER